MATTETRLLLLGTAILFEPANGYQLRRELLSWGVEDWANVKPGSIYTGLATLARQGHLDRHDLVDDGRNVAVYTSTKSGHELFDQLIEQAMTELQLHSTVAVSCAFSVAALVTRDTFARLVRKRLDDIVEVLANRPDFDPDEGLFAPPLALQPYVFWQQYAHREVTWLAEIADRIDAGEFHFKGETLWVPVEPTQSSQQLVADRDRYRLLIDEQSTGR